MARNPVTRIIITAKDEASAVFSSLQTKVAAVGVAIAGYFGARLFGDAIGSARDFESAMSAVQAASGASGAELDKLRSAAEAAGATTKYTSVEAASALENLAKSGLSATDAVQALPAVLNLAQAGGVELGTAAEYVTKAVNGMGLEFAEAGRVADVLAMGANASNTSVDGLAQALSYAAPLANSLGLSLEQTVAMIGKFADAGIDAGRAGTALNSILAQFSDPASKFRSELAAAGITTGDFDQALRQLAAAGPGGQKAINAVGQEAGPALRALLNQGIGALDALKGKLDESAGSAATFAQVMGDNLDGATKGLGSAWDALLIKLGSPVLDTLKGQVNAIAERLRGFVADGTATAFGNAIRAAFESAGRWVAEFVGKLDFTAIAASLQAFAARAGEIFTAIGQHASTAGNTLQTAYGVMSAGINIVLAAVYKLGEGMSWLASAFLADLALITDGLSKITFGDLSAGFASAAASMRAEAQATYAVHEAFGRKAGEAFDAATQGALTAREGWAALTTTATQSATATAQALGQVERQAGLTADQVEALGDGAEVSAGKVVELGTKAQQSSTQQQRAAQEAQARVADLRAEYQRLISAGDTQGATEILIEIQKELRNTGTEARATGDELELAFHHLGVTSQAKLNELAEGARRSFDLIRNSGTATPRELQQAFAAYAEKAIAANGGVASSALKAEAGMYKVRIAADEAGNAVVSSMGNAASATAQLGAQAEAAAAKYAVLGATIAGLPAPGGTPPGGPPPPGGGSKTYKRMDNGQTALLDRAERLGGLALRKSIEAEWQQKGKSMSRMAGLDPRYAKMLQDTVERLDKLQMKQEHDSGRFNANDPRVTGSAPRETVTTFRVEIGTGAGRVAAINTASRADADALVDLLRKLENDMSRA
ncbi:phage tail tape measure protein [Thauera chlorobenzoica]|uniref:Phage tail length tape-measure protein n=1 Tax=Thauera chlorobenzoica TaxID=96773 RepID=A0A1H5Z5X2_9RHOO|nr:phage tail tape measure protein [Thauera chlorobenzoica]APR05636.1 Phage tail length tape-measure protein [Thauera chlorobenzoica]SEG31410.1 phage tail tape measure protein, TP901 family, core region [Thauera chlorobenzoica]